MDKISKRFCIASSDSHDKPEQIKHSNWSAKDHDRIVRLPQVIDCTSLSRATLYRRIADGNFPAPVSLGGKSVGWRLSAINLWMAELNQAGSA